LWITKRHHQGKAGMAEEVADLRIRAQHLFAICDKEEKGFVTKRDMQVWKTLQNIFRILF
jgi:hypothetical protein